jgi:hypothetical protein
MTKLIVAFFLQFYERAHKRVIMREVTRSAQQTVPVYLRDRPVVTSADAGKRLLTKSHLHAETQPHFLHQLSTLHGDPHYNYTNGPHPTAAGPLRQRWLDGKQQLFPIIGIFNND